jgi:hypothetical protein
MENFEQYSVSFLAVKMSCVSASWKALLLILGYSRDACHLDCLPCLVDVGVVLSRIGIKYVAVDIAQKGSLFPDYWSV